MTTELYADTIGKVLRAEYGDRRFAAKRIARLADSNPRAVQNWISGTCGPAVRSLLLLMAREPAIAEAVNTLVEEQRRLDAELAQLRSARGHPGR